MSILIHVSTIIANDAGEVLFVREAKKKHKGMWNLPGGHVEIGENLKAAAIREVKEETGLDASLTALLGIHTGIAPKIHSIRHTFIGERVNSTEPIAGDEITEVQWMMPVEVIGFTDKELVGAKYLRAILLDFIEGKHYPLDVIVDAIPL